MKCLPKWSYGVTTVPSRFRESKLLANTLMSLCGAGFDDPHLFVDGDPKSAEWVECSTKSIFTNATIRNPPVRTAGNWCLSLAELYVRDPWADRYALFQDDFVTYRGLRKYLDCCVFEPKTYWNMYSFPANEALAAGRTGWYPSNQMGRGAVALVFDRDGAIDLLGSRHMLKRPQDINRGWKSVDGGICESLKGQGYVELVHNPSLVQHTGVVSSMNNRPHKKSETFRGEEFDACELCKK